MTLRYFFDCLALVIGYVALGGGGVVALLFLGLCVIERVIKQLRAYKVLTLFVFEWYLDSARMKNARKTATTTPDYIGDKYQHARHATLLCLAICGLSLPFQLWVPFTDWEYKMWLSYPMTALSLLAIGNMTWRSWSFYRKPRQC